VNTAARAAEGGFSRVFAADNRFGKRVARLTDQGVTHAGDLLLEDVAAEAIAFAELARAYAAGAAGSQSEEALRAARNAAAAVGVAFELFGDGSEGVFDTAENPDLFVRPRSTYDGAMPSGASMLLNALIDLVELTGAGGEEFLQRALGLLTSLSGAVHESPIAAVNSTRGLLRLLAIAPGAVASYQSSTPATPLAGNVQNSDNPVIEVFSSEESVEVGPDTPAELFVKIAIPEGWHINDAFAGETSRGTVQPLVLGISGGTGVRPYADYPRGEPIEAEAGAGHGVLKGDVVFSVVLERAGEWTGAPRLVMTYQACTDRACLAPVTVELQVEIKRAD
jgi:hypothetical protein